MKRKKLKKSGAAVVELAVCLPVIFTVVFASIEACNMIALKQVISESAYDGAFQAIQPDAEEANIIAGVNAVLAARNVTPSSVAIEGPGGKSLASTVRGETITVTVNAVSDGNVVGPQLFGAGKTLSSAMTGMKL